MTGLGNRTVVQDANGKLTTTAYFSDRNLPEATIDAMGFRNTYAFDAQSRLVSTRDANGGFVTNLYDTVGRLQFVQNQLSENARQYGYDLAGRVVTMADAANRLRSYTFDVAGQVTATQFPDGKIATNQYDRIGQRTTMIDWGGTSTYSFDAASRQSGQTDAAGFVQLYSFDGNGNRTGLNLVGTGLFTYTMDSLNRLSSAQKPDGLLYTMQYDADSRRTTLLLGQGSRRQYQYDANSRLTTQIELNTSNVPVVTLIDAYDGVGNRTSRNVNGTVATWTYDDLYRLTGQVKPGQVCTYTLDGVGNLKTMWEGGSFPKTFAFNAADRLATMTEGANLTTYTYTGYGALETEKTGTATTSYSYSGQDQLILVTPPSGFSSTYAFDGDGLRRTAQEGNVQPTTMVWDGSDYLLLNEPGGNRVVLTLGSEVLACGSKDLLTDPLGSLVHEISSGASLTAGFEFFPYGTPLISNPRQNTPFGYVATWGYYNDSTERDYVRAQELSKSLGRWMQVHSQGPLNNRFRPDLRDPCCIADILSDSQQRSSRLHAPFNPVDLCMQDTVGGGPLRYDFITNSVCRKMCEEMFPKNGKLIGQCKALCGKIGKKADAALWCRAVWARIEHCARHPNVASKREIELLIALYNRAGCPAKEINGGLFCACVPENGGNTCEL